MGLPGVVAEVTAASVGRGKQVVRSRITRQIELHCTLKRVADVDARFRTSLSTFFLLLFLNCFVFSFFFFFFFLLSFYFLPFLFFFSSCFCGCLFLLKHNTTVSLSHQLFFLSSVFLSSCYAFDFLYSIALNFR